MLADGILTLEKIAEYAGLPLDEVKELKLADSALAALKAENIHKVALVAFEKSIDVV